MAACHVSFRILSDIIRKSAGGARELDWTLFRFRETTLELYDESCVGTPIM